MKEKGETYERDDDELLDQLALKIVHGALDEARAIVRRHNLHAARKAALEGCELRLHSIDGLKGILARAHNDDPASNFSLAIELRDAPAHLRSQLHASHIAQTDRHTGVARLQGDFAKVIERLQIP